MIFLVIGFEFSSGSTCICTPGWLCLQVRSPARPSIRRTYPLPAAYTFTNPLDPHSPSSFSCLRSSTLRMPSPGYACKSPIPASLAGYVSLSLGIGRKSHHFSATKKFGVSLYAPTDSIQKQETASKHRKEFPPRIYALLARSKRGARALRQNSAAVLKNTA